VARDCQGVAATLIDIRLGDCLDYLRTLKTGSVDAVVTDPPYGIGKRLVSGGVNQARNVTVPKAGFANLINSKADKWDKPAPQELIDHIFRVSKHQIIWGGNFYALPPCRKPLCWDKVRPNQKKVSEWEYAWTSFEGRAEKFTYCANGGFVAKEKREHPTQKPTPLMVWCLKFLPEGCVVLDPFMGSGTTGVACIRTGRSFIGCESDPTYFAIAERRIAEEKASMPLLESVSG
jgi:site-specific DNA-methyltransferase (adenine-specific)